MTGGPVCGETHGPGPHGLFHQGGHSREILRGGGLLVPTPLAHDIIAQGSMGELRAHVQGVFPARNQVKVFGEGLPFAPGHSLVERCPGNILDPLHQLDQFTLATRGHGGKADPAIAHHHGGHTVGGRGVHLVVPGHLAIVMGMNIDPAGRRQGAVSRDRLAGFLVDPTPGHDLSVAYSEIAVLRRCSRAVNDVCALDQVVEHGDVSPLFNSRSHQYRTGRRPRGRS